MLLFLTAKTDSQNNYSVVQGSCFQPPAISTNNKKTLVLNPTVHLDNKGFGLMCLSGGLSISERRPLPSRILTELQAEAQEGQQRSEGQQQQEAIAEKHYYLFYLLFMVSPQIGNMPCE